MLGLMVILVALTGATTYRTWDRKTTESLHIDALRTRVEVLESDRARQEESERSQRIKNKAMDDFCDKVLGLLEKKTWTPNTR